MRLRIAKKICKMMTEGTSTHSAGQQRRAANIICNLKSSKEADRFWDGLMNCLGVQGRAEVLAGSGAPGMAFDLLMREGE